MPTPRKSARTASQPDPLDSPALNDSLRTLARRGVVRGYRRGTLLIQEGDHGDTLYIILDGKLRAFGTGASGREITYGTYGPGEYLGEMSLDGGPRAASVETLQASICAVVTRATLMAHIAEHPQFALELLAKVIRRARAATLSAKKLALNDVYGRLKLLIEEQAEPQSDGTHVWGERLTHNELASRLGCSREMVSRVVKDLQVGQYITIEQGCMKVLRPLPGRW